MKMKLLHRHISIEILSGTRGNETKIAVSKHIKLVKSLADFHRISKVSTGVLTKKASTN